MIIHSCHDIGYRIQSCKRLCCVSNVVLRAIKLGVSSNIGRAAELLRWFHTVFWPEEYLQFRAEFLNNCYWLKS